MAILVGVKIVSGALTRAFLMTNGAVHLSACMGVICIYFSDKSAFRFLADVFIRLSF